MADQAADTFPDFELIPADTEDLSVDDELAGLVDPDDLDLAFVEDDEAKPFGKSVWLDVDNDPSRPPVVVYDVDSFIVWATIALKTEMGRWPIFPDDFGMEDPARLIGHADDVELRAEYMRDVRDTLMQHDRVTNVGGFVWHLLDDSDEVGGYDVTVELDGDKEVVLGRTLA
jgi:hypothetical protein